MKVKVEVKPTCRTIVGRRSTYEAHAVTANGELVGEYTPHIAKVRAEALERILEHTSDLPFALWLLEVDSLCLALLSIGLFDLPDMMTRDAFDAGTEPRDFFDDEVMRVAREEGFSDD